MQSWRRVITTGSRTTRGVIGATVAATLMWAGLAAPTSAAAPTAGDRAATATAIAAAGASAGDGTLSWRLSQLVDARAEGKSPGQVASAMSLAPSGLGSLLRAPDGKRLIVTVRFASYDADEVAAVAQTGAQVVDRQPSLHRITVAVAPAALTTLSQVAGVEYVGEELAPIINGTCDTTISEGDGILHADTLRSAQGLDGSGVKVGVLSDSYSQKVSPITTAAQDVVSDNLPGSANTCGHTTDVNVGTQPSGMGCQCTDEGRAMAQVVHDVAPGAAIDFESGTLGQDAFATSIKKLATNGAKVIVDDITYPSEPFYQEGVVAQAASTVRAQGVDYFSSAANNSLQLDGHQVGSYEAVNGYRPTTCPQVVTDYLTANNYVGEKDCHDFDAGGGTDNTFGFTGVGGNHFDPDLQWAEGGGHVKTDLDEFLVDETTNQVVAIGFTHNTASQDSFESLDFTLTGDDYALVVARRDDAGAGTPRFKFVDVTDGVNSYASLERETGTGGDVMGPTTFGHNSGVDTESIGASSVFSSPSSLEPYSSYGPVTELFDTSGNPLGSPRVLAKPDVVATDCGLNTFFGGGNHFCGTSQAAPHAAAVAALLIQRQPGITPAQINATLASTAVPLAGTPGDEQGAGLINASAAGNSLGKRGTSLSLGALPLSPAYGDQITATADLATLGAPVVPVTITVDGNPVPTTGNNTHAVATLDGLPAGGHTIKATFAGDDAHDSATKTIDITVTKAVQTITGLSPAASPVDIGATYTPTATGGSSGNPVVFTVDPSTTHAACNINAHDLVVYAHAGTCVLDVNQAGNANYLDAPQVMQQVAVSKEAQAINFTTTPVHPEADGSYRPAATGGLSHNPIVFGIDPTSTAVCHLQGGGVHFDHIGTCLLTADQAGDDDRDPAPTAVQEIDVRPAHQVLRFTSDAGGPVTAPFATTKYHPHVTGIGALSFHTSPGSACSIDGSVVTFLQRGVCTLVATRAGDADHLPSYVSQRIHVRRALTVTKVAVRKHSVFIQVLPVAPGRGTPTGYVNVTIDGKRTSYVLQDGTVSIHRTLSSVPPGHYVVAVYVHSPVFRESTGTGIAPH